MQQTTIVREHMEQINTKQGVHAALLLDNVFVLCPLSTCSFSAIPQQTISP
jgi:hypothetical protein